MACSAVCRAWRDALKPFADLQALCYRALCFPKGSKVKLPSIQDSVRSTVLAAKSWKYPLLGANLPIFKSNAWPALISKVEISSEIYDEEDRFLDGPTSKLLNRHAPAFLNMAREVLREVPLPWKTKPCTLSCHEMGEYRLAVCELLESFNTSKQSCGCVASEGELLSLDGSRLLPLASGALEPLRAQGLQLLSSSYGSSATVQEAKAPGASCGTPYCSKPKLGHS